MRRQGDSDSASAPPSFPAYHCQGQEWLWAPDFLPCLDFTKSSSYSPSTIAEWIGEIGLAHLRRGQLLPAHNHLQVHLNIVRPQAPQSMFRPCSVIELLGAAGLSDVPCSTAVITPAATGSDRCRACRRRWDRGRESERSPYAGGGGR